MTEFSREQIKNDPVMNQLFEMLKKEHKVARHTKKILLENKDVQDFCEEARHFKWLSGDGVEPIYLHYDVASWYHSDGALVKIESIGIYDNFMEYESARMKGLHSAKNADIPNIN